MNVVHGPVFAGTMDLLEAFRTDPTARAQFGQLLEYLLNAASSNEALSSLLATSNDIIQLLKDDTNLVPLYQALAPALAPSTLNAQGEFVQKNVVNASLGSARPDQRARLRRERHRGLFRRAQSRTGSSPSRCRTW